MPTCGCGHLSDGFSSLGQNVGKRSAQKTTASGSLAVMHMHKLLVPSG